MKKSLDTLNCLEGEMILIDKPYGWTSFGVVAQIKKWTKAKIGHAGTLDPLASGLVICCTGKWTKKLTALIGLKKEYTAIIQLGEVTPTYDLESLPQDKKDISNITDEMIHEAVKSFTGEITQFPPIHSAIKQEGKPVYELARQGKEVIMKSRVVTISRFSITKIDLPEIHVDIECSSGTYIRSIANDLGAALGCGGYLKMLRRASIGEYKIEDAFSMDEMKDYYGSGMNVRMIVPKV